MSTRSVTIVRQQTNHGDEFSGTPVEYIEKFGWKVD